MSIYRGPRPAPTLPFPGRTVLAGVVSGVVLGFLVAALVALCGGCSSSNKTVGTTCRDLPPDGMGCVVKACQTNDADGDCSEVFYQFAGGERFVCASCNDCTDAVRVTKLACSILPDGG